MIKPRVAINGFGRMGRLALREFLNKPSHPESYDVVRLNDSAGEVATAAHLFEFDSIHGALSRVNRCSVRVGEDDGGHPALCIDDRALTYSRAAKLEAADWSDIDIVIDCTGAYRTSASLAPYFEAGVKKVVVSAPVKDGPLNVVYGVNDHLYEADTHHLVTAASCTTNALAPLISVLLSSFGLQRGAFTTIHALTNTQRVLDGFHKDLRRARSSAASLIPTSTGSATAIFEIYPELRGRLEGTAIRVPVTQASLLDCTFELGTTASADDVNKVFDEAANTSLKNIIGVEHRPLVSIDYEGERRSAVLDAMSTQVVDGSLLKLLAWYDNESGYVARMMQLVNLVARTL